MSEIQKPNQGHERIAADQMSKNLELLEKAELGYILGEAYKTAVRYDDRLAEIEIVPFEDNSKRIAFARSSTHPESSGRHEVHVLLDNLDEALERCQHILDTVPGARELFAEKMLWIEPQEVTPQLLYAYSMLHEMGHTLEYMDNEADLDSLARRNKQDKLAMPIGGATVSALLDQNSFARQWVEENWEAVVKATNAHSIDELVEMQHVAYRRTRTEKHADEVATDILAENPQMVEQLINPNFDYYRNFKAA